MTIVVGDGTKGWADQAPYGAIMVAAGGPIVPDALKSQLAVGGRLVMPVGSARHQCLQKLVRVSASRFEEEGLLDVKFEPLVGEEGWADAASTH